MEVSNQKRSRSIKRTFNLGVVLMLFPLVYFIWQEMDLAALINGGVVVLFVIGFQIVGLNYVHYQSTNDLLEVRYYPIITFFGKDYNTIRFKKRLLYRGEVKKTFLFHDLHLEIKTKQGVAEYPALSLAAMSRNDIRAIQLDLATIQKTK